MDYEHRRHHQRHNLHQKNTHIHIEHRSTFLPLLCSRPSIKEVSVPRPVAIFNDPLSPTIGCMGQVKRNNKIVGYPVSHRSSLSAKSNNSAANNAVKYSKLKRLFSGKNLHSPNSTCVSAANAASSVPPSAFSSRIRKGRNDNRESINIDQMDPPLPVIKKMPKPAEGERDNLWRRRSGGDALKSLQLKHSYPHTHHPEATTV